MTCGKIPFGLLYTTFKLLKKVNVSSWCHLIELFISFKILSQGSHPIVLIIFYCSYAKFVSELSGFACKKMFTFPTSDIMQLDCFSIFHFSPHYITSSSPLFFEVRDYVLPNRPFSVKSLYCDSPPPPRNMWSHLSEGELPASDPFWFISLASLSFVIPYIK